MKTSDGTKLPRILQAWTCLELSDLKRGESDILQKVTVKLIKHRVSKYALEAVSSSGGSGVKVGHSSGAVLKLKPRFSAPTYSILLHNKLPLIGLPFCGDCKPLS